MPTWTSRAERSHYGTLLEVEARVSEEALRGWRRVAPAAISETWIPELRSLGSVVTRAQTEIAASALVMSAGALQDQGSWAPPRGFLDPRSTAGFAPDGRDLDSLLYSPAIHAKKKIGQGLSPVSALKSAESDLLKIVVSVIADTARQAASVMTAVRPGTGYVRITHGGACSRCLILAGRFYRWNSGFLRHPQCDCQHVPAHMSAEAAETLGMVEDPYEAFEKMSEAEQNRTFGQPQAQAIRDGADMFQVVNSKRGMTPNGLFTTEGTTKRGYAHGQLKPGQRRATPELIYQWADGSKERAHALLKEHGYILPGGQNPLGALRGQREGFGALGRGGTRRAASDAVAQARLTGVRDPRSRYTMTAAERRLHDAEQDWIAVLEGRNPWVSPGFGSVPDPYRQGLNTLGASSRPLDPKTAAAVEQRYLQVLTEPYKQ